MKIIFTSNECVQINNKKEFDLVYENLRPAKVTSLSDYVKNGYPEFPIYLENTHIGVGYSYHPVDTWTKQPLKILTLSDIS